MTVRNLEALFRARRVTVLGAAQGAAQDCLMTHLARSVADGGLVREEAADDAATGSEAAVAVVLDAAAIDVDGIDRLAARGYRALLWASGTAPSQAVLSAARPYAMRVLGARSAGFFSARPALNLTAFPLAPPAGRIALIAQSQSIAAAAVDWAVERNIGLSWMAVTGAESDIDVGDLLDFAALDPGTRAVMVQVGRIRDARKFMSAARAASRLKPTMILQTPTGEDTPALDPVKSAAFMRAGLVECGSLGGMFDGLAALERLQAPEHGHVAILANGAGICALAAHAVTAQGLAVAPLAPPVRAQLDALIPGVRCVGGGVDAGTATSEQLVAAAKLLMQTTGDGAVLFVHSPLAGQKQDAIAQALSQAGLDERLVTVWLGLHTALPARRSSALARHATFSAIGDAVRAIRFRVQYARTREMLMRTPPKAALARPPRETPDAARIQRLAARGGELAGAAALEFLRTRGMALGAAVRAMPDLQVTAFRHAEMGAVVGLQALFSGAGGRAAYGLPPLDPLLAARMAEDAGLTRVAADAPVLDLLVRAGQIIASEAALSSLNLPLAIVADGTPAPAGVVRLQWHADVPSARRRLALAPYPDHFSHIYRTARGEDYIVRPVRPADEPALLHLLQSLDAEEVRLRFFTHIRHFSHDMAARMTQIDYDREMALVVARASRPDEVAGIGTIVADPDKVIAEYAILVHHDHIRQGLGRHLMECLLGAARAYGIQRVRGEVLSENAAMLNLVRNLGFSVRAVEDDPGCRVVEIALEPPPE